jgi:hypothetical protein
LPPVLGALASPCGDKHRRDDLNENNPRGSGDPTRRLVAKARATSLAHSYGSRRIQRATRERESNPTHALRTIRHWSAGTACINSPDASRFPGLPRTMATARRSSQRDAQWATLAQEI